MATRAETLGIPAQAAAPTVALPSRFGLLWSGDFPLAPALILAGIAFVAVFANLLAPYDPEVGNLAARFRPPAWQERGSMEFLLGTDHLGRDVLSRILYGSRISLLIGLSVMFISGLIGTTLGVAAGYFGGRLDLFISYLITTRLSLPVILVALAVVALVGSSLWIVILVLGLLKWDRFAVVMRSATMQTRNLDYVTAARAMGCSSPRIVLSEIMPNITGNLVVVATLEMASAILLEASLSFLGLGVQPPLPSWGLMIAEAKQYMFFSAWLINIPGLALLVLVLAINLLGDGVRDIAAPEQRS